MIPQTYGALMFDKNPEMHTGKRASLTNGALQTACLPVEESK